MTPQELCDLKIKIANAELALTKWKDHIVRKEQELKALYEQLEE